MHVRLLFVSKQKTLSFSFFCIWLICKMLTGTLKSGFLRYVASLQVSLLTHVNLRVLRQPLVCCASIVSNLSLLGALCSDTI